MSDLREKLFMILAEYGRGYDRGTDATFAAADRILALLPKVPELRWDMCGDVEALKLGDVALGAVYRTEKLGEFIGYMNGRRTIRAGEEMARAAVEDAVHKALGWKSMSDDGWIPIEMAPTDVRVDVWVRREGCTCHERRLRR